MRPWTFAAAIVLLLLSVIWLSSCDGGSDNDSPRPRPPVTQTWQIGPVIDGKNYSRNLPLHPTSNPDGSFHFDFGNGAEPHYVTRPVGSLANKERITLRFRVDGEPGTVIFGAGCGEGSASRVALYLQEKGIDWTKDGYRWWTVRALRTPPLQVNMEYTLEAELDAPAAWRSVMKYTAEDNPMEFSRSKANVERVGFTFGNCSGAGHGADATGTVRFTVLEWRVD